METDINHGVIVKYKYSDYKSKDTESVEWSVYE
jgi:hypothetical protein